MIKIDKPDIAPRKLREAGKKKRRSHCTSYTKNKKKYDSGKKTFEFNPDIYGHKTVKQALKDAQYDKCCFCESKVTHIAYGDVEHFRPKAAVRQKTKDPLGRPGYYWLAYEWSNLLFSCQLCNQRYKENLFPLKHPGKRARSHKEDIEDEEPMLINPGHEDEKPEKLISFRDEIAYAKAPIARGKVTIEALGLNRDELVEERKHHFDALQLIYHLANADPPKPETDMAKAFIAKAIENSSRYASMVRCAIKQEFQNASQ